MARPLSIASGNELLQPTEASASARSSAIFTCKRHSRDRKCGRSGTEARYGSDSRARIDPRRARARCSRPRRLDTARTQLPAPDARGSPLAEEDAVQVGAASVPTRAAAGAPRRRPACFVPDRRRCRRHRPCEAVKRFQSRARRSCDRRKRSPTRGSLPRGDHACSSISPLRHHPSDHADSEGHRREVVGDSREDIVGGPRHLR